MPDPWKMIDEALDLISDCGGVDGAHHKQWVLDQVVRILTACPVETKTGVSSGTPFVYSERGESWAYRVWLAEHQDGEYGPETYGPWDEGIAP